MKIWRAYSDDVELTPIEGVSSKEKAVQICREDYAYVQEELDYVPFEYSVSSYEEENSTSQVYGTSILLKEIKLTHKELDISLRV